ncbi:MAG: 3-deoxy-manno-octulosonate cytidylyltransferase, partial [Pirellulaceae bacterium]|nr:3-deoxy-manno-octulosonate cytidylyltransferase [Pirellulaceae bacterium]
ERAARAAGVTEVIVATDDRRIHEKVEAFGGRAWMTSTDHRCGTDRIAEVAAQLDSPIIVNVQGDEPQVEPEQVEQVIRLLADDERAVMGTLAAPMESEGAWRDPHVVKVVVDQEGFALYFSRSPIPYARDGCEPLLSVDPPMFHQHVGLYAYRRDFLLQLAEMAPSPLEQVEKLEQLRVLEAGHQILVGVVTEPTVGIDTRADYDTFVIRASNC